MYVIINQGKPRVVKIEDAAQFSEHNVPGFSWLVKAQPDLALVSTSTLVAIYNACNPANKIVKFENRPAAERRAWPHVMELAGDLKPEEAQNVPTDKKSTPLAPKPAEKKEAAPKKAKAKKERKPGIIKTFKDMARSAEGITIPEAVKALSKIFTNKADAMERTCRINLRPAYSPGETWSKTKDDKRGWVYNLRPKK